MKNKIFHFFVLIFISFFVSKLCVAQGIEPGTIKWTYPVDQGCTTPAIGHNGTIYIPSGNQLLAINPNGTLKWSFDTGITNATVGIPSVDYNDNIYFVINTYNIDHYVFYIYALDSNKNLLWRKELYTNPSGGYIASCGEVAIGPDLTIYASGSNTIQAFTSAGQPKWRAQVGELTPAISQSGNVFTINWASYSSIFELNSSDGSTYRYSSMPIGVDYPISLTIGTNGDIYIAGRSAVVTFHQDLMKYWIYHAGYVTFSQPVVDVDGTIYYTSWDSNGYYFDAVNKDGTQKFKFTTGYSDAVNGTPAIGNNGYIYVPSPSSSQALIAFNKAGEIQWRTTGTCIAASGQGAAIIDLKGTIYIIGQVLDPQGVAHPNLCAIQSSSTGPAHSAWPIYGANAQHTHVVGTGSASQKKVVFVPGFLGSRLYRKNDDGSAGDQLWETVLDGDISYLMPKPDGSFDDVNHPVTLDATKPDHGIVDKAMGVRSKYQYLIDFLDSTVGMQNWKAVPWDWRLSLDEAAENLRSEIDQMAAQGNGKVVLITHSTGGLLARAYLKKYSSTKVERFISVAAPHLGTPIAFREILHGDRDEFLNLFIPKPLWRQIGSRMHSAHQLLPTQESFETAQAYEDLGPIYNRKRQRSLQLYQDICSQGWKFNIPDKGHSTQDQFFRWLEDHPDMVQGGNVDYPLEISHPFLDRAASMQGSGGVLDWIPDIPVNLVYGLNVPTHIRTSYARKVSFDLNRVVSCDGISREYDKNLYGDGTVPSWSARSIPNQNEQVSIHPFSLSDVDGEDYDHSTIFGHSKIQTLLRSLLVNSSPSTAMSVSTEEPQRLLAAATTTPEMSVFVAYGQHVQLHAYDSQNRHTGPLPDGTEETAIPVSSYYSDGFTHKVWLRGDARAYRVEIRALQNDADVILRAESWNEVEQIDEAEFAPQRLAGNGTVTIIGSDSTTGAASDLVTKVDADGDGNSDQTAPPLVLHPLTVTPPTNGSVQSKPDGINCGTECSAPFVEGVEVILTATPQPGYAFTGWIPASCGTPFALTADTTCTATFNAIALPGDVNADSRVDALDVVAVINHFLGVQTWPQADVNGDGVVNALDVVAVINRVLGV